MKDIQKRLEKLRQAIPDTEVGIIIQTPAGWHANYAGHEARPFSTEQGARQYLKKCKTVIIIDV